MPYCPRCGKLMNDGSRFCTACGAPLEDTAQTADQTVVPPQDEATRMMPHADVVPPSSTASMPPVMPRLAEEQPPQPESKTPLIVALIVAIAVVIGLIFALATGAFLPGDNARSNSAVTEQTDSDAAKNAKNGTGNVEVKGDPNVIDDDADDGGDETDSSYERTVYEELTRYYSDLEGLDSSVRSCATEFNKTYLASDYTARQNAASAADRLEDRIDNALDELEDLDIDHSSKNYRSWRSIINLYQDLEHRIDVICEAWEVDLRYADDPSSYKDEIIAPLSVDNVPGTNDNRYRLDYENNYASAKPVEP